MNISNKMLLISAVFALIAIILIAPVSLHNRRGVVSLESSLSSGINSAVSVNTYGSIRSE